MESSSDLLPSHNRTDKHSDFLILILSDSIPCIRAASVPFLIPRFKISFGTVPSNYLNYV